MGEIERIHPVLRTVLESRLDHKVDQDRKRRQNPGLEPDQLELANSEPDSDTEVAPKPPLDPDSHLDLSA